MTFNPKGPNATGFLRECPGGCNLAIRVQPGAKRTAITGVYDGLNRQCLNIALQAPPVEGKANLALIAFLAKLLSVPRSRVAISHGEHDRFKVVTVSGLASSEVRTIVENKLRELV